MYIYHVTITRVLMLICYVETLNEIERCVSELKADFVLLGGDMNTDLSRNKFPFEKEWAQRSKWND